MESGSVSSVIPPPGAEVISRHGFRKWSSVHEANDPHIGTLPHMPLFLRGQRMRTASTALNIIPRTLGALERTDIKPIKAGIFLPKLSWIRAYEKLYRVSVGNDVADNIINAFYATPASVKNDSSSIEQLLFEDDDPSILEYAIACLEQERLHQQLKPEEMSKETVEPNILGLTSGHIGSYADIAEFAAGLSIAIAHEKGLRYMDQVGVLINKNMTYETYKIKKRVQVPISMIGSLGLRLWWGLPPGESADTYLPKEVQDFYNRLFNGSFREARKKRNQIIAYVPAGSRMTWQINPDTGEEEIWIKDPSFTASLARGCNEGTIVGNRVGDNVKLSQVISSKTIRERDGKEINRPKNELMDEIVGTIAEQTHELTGKTVNFLKLSPEKHSVRFPEEKAA